MSDEPHGPLVGRTAAVLSLAVLAVAAAGLWRLEVAWHGWEGLTWLEYTHWAVPAGVALFVGWTAAVGEFPTRTRRWACVAVGGVLAAAMYVATKYAVYFLFVAGPSAMPLVMEYGPEGLRWLRYGAMAWFVAVPLIVASTARLLGLSVSIGDVVVSVLVFVCSYPAALELIELFESSVYADAIHALKTGYVIPLQVVGLGIPFLPERDP